MIIYVYHYVHTYMCVYRHVDHKKSIDANGGLLTGSISHDGQFKALEPAPRQRSLLRSLIGVWHLSCRWEV